MKSFTALVALVVVGGLAVGVLVAVVGLPPPAIGATAAAPASAAASGPAAHASGPAQHAAASGAADRRLTGGDEAAGRGSTTGTIERVDAARLAVRTTNGVVEVALADSTVYQKLTKASLADLKVGENVIARGEPAGDTLVARNLQAMVGDDAAHAGPGAGGWRGGRDGQDGEHAAGAGGARGAVFGRVERVEGKTVTVATPAGPRVVTVADDAEVRKATAAARADLKVGQTVTVGRAGGPDTPAAGVTILEG